MEKQEYLIKLLGTLRSVWPAAEGFLVVMKAGGFDNTVIDTLVTIIEKAIKDTKDEVAKKKLEGSLTILEKIKDMEEKSNEKDKQECDELLEKLDSIL